ncbi:hypothetical protein [Kordia zhangzhouensis]|uniref:hypothetical protein n=1 Tax=Kordia zhangzhouensis TaxID=1620405 RepID=UPI00069AD3A3|nr:hypothetical protein [Kordia zhangzhouensis]
MKTQTYLLLAMYLLLTNFTFAQSNTFPSNGNVGIGTSVPTAKTDIYIPDFATMESGLRVTSPFSFQSGSTINTIFHLRKIGRTKNEFFSQFVVKTNGNVGVGINYNDPLLNDKKMVITDNNPNAVDLNVRGFALIDGQNASLLFGATGGESLGQWGIEYNEYATVKGLNFWKPAGSNNFGNYYMFLTDTGKVSIGLDPNAAGTYNGDFKLYVSEGIMTEKVKVTLRSSSDWSDYVFEDDYKLLPLEEVEAHIEKNGHLPNVPSAEEVAKEGIDLAKMDAKLLEKIEELTLYVIEQQKQIKELQEQLKTKS